MEKKNIAVIPARGGSKGVPGKNKKLLHGKPLIQYSIDCFEKSEIDFDLIVSTDDEDIKRIAKDQGITIHHRSTKAASDTAGMKDVVIELFEKLGYTPELFLLLQPTSPLRLPEDIQNAISIMDEGTNAIVSLSEAVQYPQHMFTADETGFITPFMDPNQYKRRQDIPKYYHPNGSIYLVRGNVFQEELSFYPSKTKIIEIPVHRSLEIDTMWDWKLCELLLKNNKSI